METTVLVINPGSSSREYAIFSRGKSIINAYYEHLGEKCALTIIANGVEISRVLEIEVFGSALGHFLELCRKSTNISGIDGIGIRIVSPGRRFMKHQLLDSEFHDYLKNNVERAPLHINIELNQIEQTKMLLNGTPIFMISDSEFHKTLSHEARNYAINRSDADKYDIYRFGYHGISVASIVHVLKEQLSLKYRRIIVCHLGSGSSITAIKDWEKYRYLNGLFTTRGLNYGYSHR